MSGQGTDEMLDAAHERLRQAADGPVIKRTKNPEYAVFRQCEVDAEPDTYLLINNQVKASSRRGAIISATGELEEGLKGGVFLVIPSAQVQMISRRTRTEVVDEWGS
jgi:hypothetical protein